MDVKHRWDDDEREMGHDPKLYSTQVACVAEDVIIMINSNSFALVPNHPVIRFLDFPFSLFSEANASTPLEE